MKQIPKQSRFFIALGIQVLIIALLIFSKFFIYQNGTVISLEIQPVDPRSPLRGDYMTFSYSISNIPSTLFTSPPNNGDTVYVPLAKTGSYWQAAYGVGTQKPVGTETIFLKGKVVGGGQTGAFDAGKGFGNYNPSNIIHVQYGIEEYFIPEGKGQTLPLNNKQLYAQVAINDSGDAVLKQVYFNGNPWP